MNKQYAYAREKKVPIILFFVISFLLFSRFYRILEIPTALVHDELIYVMQAKSLQLSGSDMSGRWNPWSLQPFNSSFAELPSVVMALGISSTSNPIVNAKITHVVVGMLLPFVLSWFIFGIWKNKVLALTTLVLASVNPWLWQFSRMSFDSLFSIFFYLLGGAVVLSGKQYWKLLSIPIFLLGFYQYQGMKLIFLPFIVLVCGVVLIEKKYTSVKSFSSKLTPELLSIVIIICFSILLFSQYVFVALPQQSASSRLSQIVFFEKEYISKEVAADRQLSLGSPFDTLLTNKYSVIASIITKNIFKTLNPIFIFFAADEGANRFVTTNHGYLYLLDFALIFIGVFFLVRDSTKWKVSMYFLLLLVSLIPAVVNIGQSFTFRAALFYLLLIPLASYAITVFIKNKSKLLLASTIVLYAMSIGNFTHHYFYRYPVYAADGQFFVERVLASYISRVPQNKKVIVYSFDQEALFNSYLFYNNKYTDQSFEKVNQAIASNRYVLDNVEFRNTCIDTNQLNPNEVLIVPADPNICKTNEEPPPKTILQEKLSFHLSIPAITDSGELYKIFGDSLCSQFQLGTYIVPRSSEVFSVESLNDADFCQNWITNLAPLNTP